MRLPGGSVDDNPAHDPTRPWSRAAVDDVEAGLFLRTIRGTAVRTLRYYCEHPGRALGPADVSAGTGAAEELVRTDITRINKFAEANGHVPLLEAVSGGYAISREGAEVFAPLLPGLGRGR